MGTVRAIRRGAIATGPATEGMNRKTVELGESVVAAETRIEPGAISAWHHHGEHTACVYILQGQLHIEWGAGGNESLDLSGGDFYVIPANTIHRESNPGSTEATVGKFFLVGTGAEAINVDGPEAAA